jgi:hypothetical protein
MGQRLGRRRTAVTLLLGLVAAGLPLVAAGPAAAATATIDVCNAAASPTVQGSFSFHIISASSQLQESVMIGQCSPQLDVSAGSVTVQEQLNSLYALVAVAALPQAALLSQNLSSGTAVVEATAGFLTTVIFSTGIGTGQVAVNPSPPPKGARGAPYSFNFHASGGTPPYKWKKAPGTKLPKGLKLSSSGLLSGTPSTKKLAAGAYNISVQVHDSTKHGHLVAAENFTLSLS